MRRLWNQIPPQGRRGSLGRLRGLSLALAVPLLALGLAAPAEAQKREFYGVVTFGPFQAGHLQPPDYERMQEAGVGTLRFLVPWGVVESKPGQYNWAGQDRVIGSAAARGIRSQPFVDGPPPHLQRPLNQPRHRRAFRRLMSAMAKRYKPGGDYWRGPYKAEFGADARPLPVRTYQLLNEPNSRHFWCGSPAPPRCGASPRAYGRMVKMGASGVRSQQPRAEILLGGMFAKPRGRGSMTSWQFLRRLYRVKRIKRAFDTVAVHPYSPNLRGIGRIMRRIRQVMRRSNHRAGGIRVTEFGWGSHPSSHPLTKTPEVQARLLQRAFRLFARQRHKRRWNVKGVTWFSWQNGGGCPYCDSSGLVAGYDRWRHPILKPSWYAFRAITP